MMEHIRHKRNSGGKRFFSTNNIVDTCCVTRSFRSRAIRTEKYTQPSQLLIVLLGLDLLKRAMIVYLVHLDVMAFLDNHLKSQTLGLFIIMMRSTTWPIIFLTMHLLIRP